MEDRFKVNKRKENLIYLVGFIFSGVINIAFWVYLPSIIQESVEGDGIFIALGGFAVAGSFIGYITKTGVEAWRYDSGKWSIGNDYYDFEDGEFIIIPKTPINNETVDWGSITFPKVKKLSGPVAHKLPSVKPI
jgi:hypothetical protein